MSQSVNTTLQAIAERLHEEGIFTGGPPQLFESAGRLQFSTLIREGLWPHSKVLDIGCGALRAGYWLVRFLEPERYYGIEPNRKMLDKGIEYVLTPELLRAKRPAFNHNDRFDVSVFSCKFDVFLARSIWTHASKPQIQTMLDGFRDFSEPGAFFLTSFIPGKWYSRDYRGATWVGKSDHCETPGLVSHRFGWVQNECRVRGLTLEQLPDPPFNGQLWLKICH
jgi:SAM-dependent methyltransferase